MFGINRYKINLKKDDNSARVLKVLEYFKGKEVSAWTLSFDSKVLHYTNIIMILRRKGYNIENRTEWKGRVRHSFYKLIIDNDIKREIKSIGA